MASFQFIILFELQHKMYTITPKVYSLSILTAVVHIPYVCLKKLSI